MLKYTRNTFKHGKLIDTVTNTMTAIELYGHIGQVGSYAFLALLNKWNRLGLLGFEQSGTVYVYTTDDMGE